MATLDNYSPEKKGSFFRALATQSILDAAMDFGFDKCYDFDLRVHSGSCLPAPKDLDLY